MAEDDEGTLAALKVHRAELFDPEITLRNGRVVKLMGDGVLVMFPSAVDARLPFVVQDQIQARTSVDFVSSGKIYAQEHLHATVERLTTGQGWD